MNCSAGSPRWFRQPRRRPVVEQLNTWINEIVATDEAREFLNKFGGDPWITTPEQGQAQLEKEKSAWEGYVKAAKIEQQ